MMAEPAWDKARDRAPRGRPEVALEILGQLIGEDVGVDLVPGRRNTWATEMVELAFVMADAFEVEAARRAQAAALTVDVNHRDVAAAILSRYYGME